MMMSKLRSANVKLSVVGYASELNMLYEICFELHEQQLERALNTDIYNHTNDLGKVF